MCYTKRDRELEKEARKITESRLMEDARHRQEEHDRRRAKEKEDKPLTEKVKEMVGAR